VDDHLHVIEHDPLARRKSVDRNGADALLLFQPILDLAGDRLQMRFRRSRANDEEIGEAGDALKIEDDDVFRFFVRRVIGAGFS
jgi:hypothetical protein